MTRITELELAKRLADVKAMIDAVATDEDGNMADLNMSGHFLSALDHALRGDPGCNEPDEWDEGRLEAMIANRDYLGL